MSDILISFDQSGYESKKAVFEHIGLALQNVVDSFNALGFAPLNPTEFERLFTDTEGLVFDKMTGGKAVSIAGLEVDKHKAMELLIKPAGYDELLNNIKFTYTSPYGNDPIRFDAATSTNTTFDLEDGKVTLKASKDLELQSNYKRYAKTDMAKKMLEFANTIIAKAEDLNLMDHLKYNPNGIGNTVKHLINGGDGKDVSLNIDGVLKYNEVGFRYH